MTSGWPHDHSPFHSGEQKIQAELELRDEVEARARKIIRDYMPEQHQQFFASLSYVFLAVEQENEECYLICAYGEPGFVSASNSNTLVISKKYWFTPKSENHFSSGQKLGLVGLNFSNRRRNRLNGTIADITETEITMTVDQSFGNCPKYIQQREALFSAENTTQAVPTRNKELPQLLARADTFFIATCHHDKNNAYASGVDVSHRGGKPGFIRLVDNTMTFPDFRGNRHFSTLGNLLLNPKVSLLFIDFELERTVRAQGEASILWSKDTYGEFEGAERFVQIILNQDSVITEKLPIRWSDKQDSPFIEDTGVWE